MPENPPSGLTTEAIEALKLSGDLPPGYAEFLKHFVNYQNIAANPDAHLTAEQKAMDAVGFDGDIRPLMGALPVPAHPDHPQTTLPKQIPQRTANEVSSDALVDSVLFFLITQMKDPKPVLEAMGADKVGFNNDLSVIAVADPYSGNVRAFKRLALKSDFDTPANDKPSSRGFSAAGFAEIKVDSKYTTPGQFIAAQGNSTQLELLPKVRAIYGGYQFSFDGSAAPGQLNRELVPNQLSRVAGFNKELLASMKQAGLPAETQMDFTSHSLGCGNMLLSRFYWQNDPSTKEYGRAGPTTTIEPIGEAIQLRQLGTLIAEAKRARGENANVETEIANLTRNIDVVTITPESNIQKFQIGNSLENGRVVGDREFHVPFDKTMRAADIPLIFATDGLAVSWGATDMSPVPAVNIPGIPVSESLAGYIRFKNHFSEAIAGNLFERGNQGGLVPEEAPNLATPAQIADAPSGIHPKDPMSMKIQTFMNGMLAYMQQQPEHAPGTRRDEAYFAETIRDIGKSMGIPPGKIEEIIVAAQTPAPPATGEDVKFTQR